MIRTRYVLLAPLLLIALVGPACNPEEMPITLPTPGTSDVQSIRIGDDTRQYEILVPEVAAPVDGWPLVIVLHGLGSNASQMRALTGFDELAIEEKFIAVYPNGLARAWLDAGATRRFSGTDIAVRNLEFIEALIDEIDREHGVDDRRVYMIGLSNGAMFAFHAACHFSDPLAAVSLVAAASISQSYDSCEPDHPVGYIAFHGTSDTVVPYPGGAVVPGFESLGEFQSAHEAAAFWADINGCDNTSSREQLADSRSTDYSIAYRESWEPCDSGRPVELITLDGAGHTWPGHPPSGRRTGATNLDIDATRTTWEFFAANPKPAQ